MAVERARRAAVSGFARRAAAALRLRLDSVACPRDRHRRAGPRPAPGRGLPILGQLVAVRRGSSCSGRSRVEHRRRSSSTSGCTPTTTVLFIASAAAILGLAWVVGLSTERLGLADRAAGRRHPQRDVRQHRRADHRVLRAAGRPHRGRQGVAHRLDHRQPAARPGRERADRRPAPRHPDVQPEDRRRRTPRCSCWPSSGCSCRRSSRSRRATPTQGSLTEESVLVAVVLIVGYVLSLDLPVHATRTQTLGGHGEPAGPRRPGLDARTVAIVVLLGAAALLAVLSEILVGSIEPFIEHVRADRRSSSASCSSRPSATSPSTSSPSSSRPRTRWSSRWP